MDKVIVAVSGGSDSFALLDMMYKTNKYELIVCHVNYHYRDSSNRDEELVKKYCNDHQIKFYLLSLDSKKEKVGNFENWARVKRYEFFKQIYDLEKCKYLLVGHQKEDFIETFLIQEKRKGKVDYYGLNKEVTMQGMRVLRPLLNYTKKELEIYCKENHLEFGVDETNFDCHYQRNKFRHEVISELSESEKQDIINRAMDLNNNRSKEIVLVDEAMKNCLVDDEIDLIHLNKYEDKIKKEVIYHFVINKVNHRISISDGRLSDMLKKIESNKPNLELAKYDDWILYKEYKKLVMAKNNIDYCYEIREFKNVENRARFSLSNEGKKLEKVIVKKEQFPLYIKNYDGKNTSINRIFIDKKIPLRLRKSWPLIVDKFGVLLLVIDIKKFYNEKQNCDDCVEFYVHMNKGE